MFKFNFQTLRTRWFAATAKRCSSRSRRWSTTSSTTANSGSPANAPEPITINDARKKTVKHFASIETWSISREMIVGSNFRRSKVLFFRTKLFATLIRWSKRTSGVVISGFFYNLTLPNPLGSLGPFASSEKEDFRSSDQSCKKFRSSISIFWNLKLF
jgi:hypothetical protein